jgi:hypothetical protein
MHAFRIVLLFPLVLAACSGAANQDLTDESTSVDPSKPSPSASSSSSPPGESTPQDAATPVDAARSADARPSPDAAPGADAAPHDSGAPHPDSAPVEDGGPFGARCTNDSECTSGVCFSSFLGSYCSMRCRSSADCPSPPTSGRCSLRG